MKETHFGDNMTLIRSVWGMNRQELGQLLGCKQHQIGNYERGSIAVTLPIIFLLEDLTALPAKRLYYEALTRADIANQPVRTNIAQLKAPPQYNAVQLTLEERVKRLEIKVFGKLLIG